MDEATLPAPRFDEQAAQQARPVVPLSGEAVPQHPGVSANYYTGRAAMPSKMWSWLLAAFVGLIVGAVAMGAGIAAYRRNKVKPARPLAPAASMTALELNQDFRPGPSSRSNAAVPKIASDAPVANASAANAPAAAPVAPKPTRRRRAVVSSSSENAASESDSSGKPRPRLVDRYVMPSRRP